MRKLLVVLGGLVVLGAIIGVLFLRPKSPENGAHDTANRFLASMKSKDTTASYALFSTSFKKRVSIKTWSDYLKNEGDYTSIKYVGIAAVTNPSKAYPATANPQKLNYDLTAGDRSYLYTLIAIQEENIWKINEFDRFVK